MPIIDGEKYACQSCIKGHRVSGCNHTDRELHHINPKGRPVKQCEHCRGARKSKSHHAKCECGDRKDKHKDKGDAKGEQLVDVGTGEISNHATVHGNHCGCHSGSKCICGIKKEPVDLKLDTSKQTLHDVRARPKVTATHSESNLTVFANGHHRPCHRNNNTAHVSGAPYKIPRPHTLHGTAFEQYMKTSYSQPEPPAQRSVDTFSLSNRDFYTMLGAAPQNEALPLTPISGSLDTTNYQESIFSNRSATFPQENCSPTESHLTDAIGQPQWPWSNSLASINRNFGYGSLSTSPSQECLPNPDSEWPLSSAGLIHPTWSAGDLPLDTSNLADSVIQPISNSGESKISAPELSTSSSPSEVGEQNLFSDLAPASAVSETLFWEDKMPVYHLAPTVNEIRPPTSAPHYPTSETQGLEFDLSKTLGSVAPMPATTGGNLYGETPAIAMPNNLDDIAANDAWSFDEANLAFTGFEGFDMPPSTFPNWI